MSHDEVESLARELQSAYETGQMVANPPSERPGFDLDQAYDIEAMLKRSREAGGQKAVGRKVGYANKAMWRVFKLETLVWAHMYDDTVHYTARQFRRGFRRASAFAEGRTRNCFRIEALHSTATL